MRALVLLLLGALLAACGGAPKVPQAQALFDDALFQPPMRPIAAADVFALSTEMRRYMAGELAAHVRRSGPQRGLIEALYRKGQLRLDYDSTFTRNAAEAFDARSGNCLSLVIMTAAFAKELGLSVRYQSVYVPQSWSRSGDLYFSSGHVNLSLAKRPTASQVAFDLADVLIVDFLPPEETRGQRAQAIPEETIVAMYMNNRAAETLAHGHLDEAYWWARAAVAASPTFLSARNTLAVVYTRGGHLRQAQRVLDHVLAVEPANTQAMANLVVVLRRLGREEDAQRLSRRLAEIEPQPPFHFFNLGMAALRRGEHAAARDWFRKEVQRAAYYHEFHFWLAVAYHALGDTRLARKHLARAMENSPTRGERELYAAKLDRLRSSSQ